MYHLRNVCDMEKNITKTCLHLLQANYWLLDRLRDTSIYNNIKTNFDYLQLSYIIIVFYIDHCDV